MISDCCWVEKGLPRDIFGYNLLRRMAVLQELWIYVDSPAIWCNTLNFTQAALYFSVRWITYFPPVSHILDLRMWFLVLKKPQITIDKYIGTTCTSPRVPTSSHPYPFSTYSAHTSSGLIRDREAMSENWTCSFWTVVLQRVPQNSLY